MKNEKQTEKNDERVPATGDTTPVSNPPQTTIPMTVPAAESLKDSLKLCSTT